MGFAFVHFSRILAVIPWNFWKKSWELAELKNSVFLLLHPHDNQLNLLVSSLKQHLRINMQYSVPTNYLLIHRIEIFPSYIYRTGRFSKYVVNIAQVRKTGKGNKKWHFWEKTWLTYIFFENTLSATLLTESARKLVDTYYTQIRFSPFTCENSIHSLQSKDDLDIEWWGKYAWSW